MSKSWCCSWKKLWLRHVTHLDMLNVTVKRCAVLNPAACAYGEPHDCVDSINQHEIPWPDLSHVWPAKQHSVPSLNLWRLWPHLYRKCCNEIQAPQLLTSTWPFWLMHVVYHSSAFDTLSPQILSLTNVNVFAQSRYIGNLCWVPPVPTTLVN